MLAGILQLILKNIVEMVKRELAALLRRLAFRAVLLILGVIVIGAGIFHITLSISYILSSILPRWVSSLLTGIITIAAGLILAYLAIRR